MKNIVRAALQGGVELLLYLPLLLIISVYALPDSSMWPWIGTLPLCYATGFGINSYFSINRFYQLLIVMVLVASAQAYSLFGMTYAFYVAMPLGCLLVYRGARFVTEPWNSYFSVGLYGVGISIYFFSSIILRIVPSFQPYLQILTGGGLLALAITLFMINQAHIQHETLSGKEGHVLSASVVWQNRFLILNLFVVIVLVALFRNLRQWMIGLIEQAGAWIRELLSLLPSSSHVETDGKIPWKRIKLPGFGELPAWLIWIGNAALTIFIILFAVSLVYLIYLTLKKLLALVKRWYAWLIALLIAGEKWEQASGYEDDVENLINWKELHNRVTARFKDWMAVRSKKSVKWGDLKNNRERIRYLYRSLLMRSVKQGYTFKPHLTPRETGCDIQLWDEKRQRQTGPMVTLYEQVRYGGKQVDDRDVILVKEEVEGEKGDT